MQLKILIVDDEPPARANLVHLLGETAPDAEIGEAANGIEAARMLGAMKPDLLFLDIQMPGLDGLALMRFLPSDRRPLTVFVTAHRDFAVDAFDLEAVDYLVKPFRRERFAQTMQRVKNKLGEARDRANPSTMKTQFADRLCIKDGNRHIFVEIAAIDWVGSAGNYVEIHAGADTHLMRTTLKALQRSLPGGRFVRIHRGILVNQRRISQITATESGDYSVCLQSGQTLTMSRRRKAALRALLGEESSGANRER